MDIVMTLEPHGWLDILVQPNQGEQIEIPVSFLSDAVDEIARQFVALHKGATEVTEGNGTREISQTVEF